MQGEDLFLQASINEYLNVLQLGKTSIRFLENIEKFIDAGGNIDKETNSWILFKGDIPLLELINNKIGFNEDNFIELLLRFENFNFDKINFNLLLKFILDNININMFISILLDNTRDLFHSLLDSKKDRKLSLNFIVDNKLEHDESFYNVIELIVSYEPFFNEKIWIEYLDKYKQHFSKDFYIELINRPNFAQDEEIQVKLIELFFDLEDFPELLFEKTKEKPFLSILLGKYGLAYKEYHPDIEKALKKYLKGIVKVSNNYNFSITIKQANYYLAQIELEKDEVNKDLVVRYLLRADNFIDSKFLRLKLYKQCYIKKDIS